MKVDETIRVVAGVIRRGDEVLLAQRFDDTHLGGLWEFPGGKVQKGESLKGALGREVREELGVEVRVGELYFETTHVYPDRRVHLSFFECQLVRGTPQSRQVARWTWTRPAELGKFALPEANRDLIDKLVKE